MQNNGEEISNKNEIANDNLQKTNKNADLKNKELLSEITTLK